MKILWVPQLSAQDKIEKKYLVHADSNWRFFENLCAGFSKEIEVVLLMPSKNVLNFSNISLPKCVSQVFFNTYSTIDVFGTRFNFDFDYAKKMLKSINFDAIFLNDPTLAMNWRAAMIQAKSKAKLCVYNHWLDCKRSPKTPRGMTYNIRQIEGALFADLVMSNTNFSLDDYASAAKDYFKRDIKKKVKNKMLKLPPAYNEDYFKKLKVRKKKCIIAYNQRLSSLPYYSKSYLTFCKIVNEIFKENENIKNSFVVRFFNPNYYNTSFLNDFSFNYEVVCPNDSDTYLRLLSECICTADFYRDERIWSIALEEAAAVECVPILRYFDGYKEMFNKHYFGYFSSEKQAKKKIESVCESFLYDKNLYENTARAAKSFMKKKYSSKIVAKTFLSKLMKL